MAYSGGKLADGTPLNVAVYRAYRNAGLSHNQALAITAEVGRENSFNPNVLFGTHTDPAANNHGGSIRNVGMLSWNQGRDTPLLNSLNRAGLLQNGAMIRNQANLNAQAAYSVSEMKGRWRNRLQHFWNNPNADPESFSREVGKNYVGWAYGQNTIKAVGGGRKAFDWQSHDNRRRGYLGTLNNMLGGKPLGNYSEQPSFQPPQIMQGFDKLVAQSSSFQPPELKQGFDKLLQSTQQQPTFRSPELMQGFDKLQSGEQPTQFAPPQIMQGFDKLVTGNQTVLQSGEQTAVPSDVTLGLPSLPQNQALVTSRPEQQNVFVPPELMPNFADLQKNVIPTA